MIGGPDFMKKAKEPTEEAPEASEAPMGDGKSAAAKTMMSALKANDADAFATGFKAMMDACGYSGPAETEE